jgi:8-oxo-dGTP pyrophosphatase MutT (NUDIX family)
MSDSSITLPQLRRRFRAREARRLPTTDRTHYAAVAAVLRLRAEDPEVLLIRRAEHPHDHWSGHMAFPGGRQDRTDPSTLHTAIRETLEEVDVDLESHAELLGRLDDVQAISKGKRRDMLIVPYVFALTRDVEPHRDPTEVAELLWAPVRPMMAGEMSTTRPYELEGKRMQLPGYRIGETRIVWGLTYRMLELLFDVIRR